MLDSELTNDFYIITWDNPLPANSSGMIRALKRLGRVEGVHAKTTVKLFPKSSVNFGNVRRSVRINLNRRTGRAVVVSIANKHVSHIDNAVARGTWKKA